MLQSNDDIFEAVEQYKRVIRWFRKFEKINGKIIPIVSGSKSNEIFKSHDDVLAFFMNCHHMRDWLIEYAHIPNDEVDDFRKQNPPLLLCADIANGAKHAILNKYRNGHQPECESAVSIEEETLLAAERGELYQVRTFYPIHQEDGNIIDAFEVATDCVYLWRKFLEDNNVFREYENWWKEAGGIGLPHLDHPEC